ncbi:patatin-related protein [Amycolatopsis xylanica]|uniref:Patatin-related protein n=1 Tax=Amycolatopsis xylanica TaxID=589385 RepID=A0A1H2YRU2_9PSEU|nr:patatin-related protein [Amycolatopsis xylanica]
MQTSWQQDIRIAMTMVGGSSLAVWMGGVAAETSELLHATGDSVYRRLLDLLNATVSLDVLTGTSAGSINVACLGLAEAYGSTPAVLRDSWIEMGALEKLLRDPGEKQPRSLFDGDKVLLGGLQTALRDIIGDRKPVESPDVTVLLTGTMIDAETARFDDALGNLVRDSEHRLVFRFDRPLWNNGVVEPLALAARSSASFPGAFELSCVPVGVPGGDKAHPDMNAYVDVTRSHWLTDGGVLLKKPLGPALREIFERPAEQDVRRLLLYVVPTGEGEAEQKKVDPKNPPLLGGAMSQVVAAVLNQSISAEFDELTRHNDAVVKTRGTRVSLAALGCRVGAEALVDERLMKDYRQRRVQEDATQLVREATRRLNKAGGNGEWASGVSAELRAAAIKGLCTELPETLPEGGCEGAELVAFRTSALDDAVATGLQLINSGFRLGPSPEQAALFNDSRTLLHQARKAAAREIRLTDWIGRQRLPKKDEELVTWVNWLADEWAFLGRKEQLAGAWKQVVDALRAVTPALRLLPADKDPDAANTVKTLLDWLGLTDDQRTASDALVNTRLLTLHIATRGLLAQLPSVDQRVDLVQVSADSRTLLDMKRSRATDKLTGMQADYFGAFYKSSWRANDWMWGRIDAVGWLLQCLLDPKRLRLLAELEGKEAFRDKVKELFDSIGWRSPSEDDNITADEAAKLGKQLDAELAFLGLDGELHRLAEFGKAPVSMPITAMVLARSRQLQIARAELPVVAKQATEDAVKARGNGKLSERFRKLNLDAMDDDSTRRAFRECQVSAERLEGERGSMLLTKTLIKAGAAGLNAVTSATPSMPASVRPAAQFARATGRSAWWIAQGAANLRAPWNFLAAAVTVLAGFILGNQTSAVLQWIGLPVVAGAGVFLLVSVFALRTTWRRFLTVLLVLVAGCLLFAGFIPPIREPLFGWLGSVMAAFGRGEAAVWWLVVVALLILPVVVTPAGALWRRLRRKA